MYVLPMLRSKLCRWILARVCSHAGLINPFFRHNATPICTADDLQIDWWADSWNCAIRCRLTLVLWRRHLGSWIVGVCLQKTKKNVVCFYCRVDNGSKTVYCQVINNMDLVFVHLNDRQVKMVLLHICNVSSSRVLFHWYSPSPFPTSN
jgi:hypothetical protein